MIRLTTTIKRHWLNEILSGRKTVEYRQVKPYWIKRLRGIETPFELRLINGMTKNAPECTCLIDEVKLGVVTNPMTEADDYLYHLHIAKIIEAKNTEGFEWPLTP